MTTALWLTFAGLHLCYLAMFIETPNAKSFLMFRLPAAILGLPLLAHGVNALLVRFA